MRVVVSGKSVEKLLGIPRLPNTSGDQMERKDSPYVAGVDGSRSTTSRSLI